MRHDHRVHLFVPASRRPAAALLWRAALADGSADERLWDSPPLTDGVREVRSINAVLTPELRRRLGDALDRDLIVRPAWVLVTQSGRHVDDSLADSATRRGTPWSADQSLALFGLRPVEPNREVEDA
jgi:hypothetical protein